MRRASAEESACTVASKSSSNRQRGADAEQSKTRKEQRMARQQSNGPEDLVEKRVRVTNEWRHQAAIGRSIAFESSRRRFHRTFENGRRSVVERMCERERRFDPLDVE